MPARLVPPRACRGLLVAAAVLAAPLGLAPAARAGQIVYRQTHAQGGDTFGVMNEDGGGQRTWLSVYDDVPASGGTRFVTGFEPRISADGRRVVFTTQTYANYDGGLALGANAEGVNLWEAGTIRRLSAPPAPAPNTTTLDSHGAPAADGHIVYSSLGAQYSSSGQLLGTYGQLDQFTAAGGDGGQFVADCDGTGLATGGLAINPVQPAELAYGGCVDTNGDKVIAVGSSGGADDTVVRTAPTSPDGSDSTVHSPAWRPDGGRIVSIEAAGQGPDSLVDYAPDGSGAVRVLTAPADASVSQAVFVGNDRIAFDVFTGSGDSSASDIYVVPASCVDCTLGNATRLTTDGHSEAPSWSPAGLVLPAAPGPGPTPGGPGGGATGPTGSDGSGGPGGGGAGGGVPGAAIKLKGRPSVAKGVKVALRCAVACSAKAVLAVDAKAAKRLGLGKRTTLGQAKGSLAAPGTTTLRIKLSAKARVKLKRARSVKATIVVRVTDASGARSKVKAKLKLAR